MGKFMKNTIKNIASKVCFSRLRPLFLLSMVALTACALPEKPRPSTSYDFGPGAVPATTAGTTQSLPALVLFDIEYSPALDSTALLYRLAYADAQALSPYAQARWSMPPAQLLRQQVRAQLGATRPILAPGETLAGNAAPWSVRLELEEFSQVFESPSVSSGLVRLRASVSQPSAQGDRLLGQRWITVQRPAPTADAPGGVRALSAATQAAVAELGSWLGQLR
jgi:cholesterol transport system auxiliary component